MKNRPRIIYRSPKQGTDSFEKRSYFLGGGRGKTHRHHGVYAISDEIHRTSVCPRRYEGQWPFVHIPILYIVIFGNAQYGMHLRTPTLEDILQVEHGTLRPLVSWQTGSAGEEGVPLIPPLANICDHEVLSGAYVYLVTCPTIVRGGLIQLSGEYGVIIVRDSRHLSPGRLVPHGSPNGGPYYVGPD